MQQCCQILCQSKRKWYNFPFSVSNMWWQYVALDRGKSKQRSGLCVVWRLCCCVWVTVINDVMKTSHIPVPIAFKTMAPLTARDDLIAGSTSGEVCMCEYIRYVCNHTDSYELDLHYCKMVSQSQNVALRRIWQGSILAMWFLTLSQYAGQVYPEVRPLSLVEGHEGTTKQLNCLLLYNSWAPRRRKQDLFISLAVFFHVPPRRQLKNWPIKPLCPSELHIWDVW